MIDIEIIRKNPELVKENIRKKFQLHKLENVDKILELDLKIRELKQNGDNLRQEKNKLSDQIGLLYKNNEKEKAQNFREKVNVLNEEIKNIEEETESLGVKFKNLMYTIPNIMSPNVPIGKDDTQNVEGEKFLEAKEKPFDIPYHIDILEKLGGVDIDSARRTSGQGFYYFIGDIALLHSAIFSYAREFMISKGFTYVVPPYMIRGDIVNGVMSFEEMDELMYKIEGEDLYLIGTSEHSMIGRFIGQIIDSNNLPLTLTSYSACFRKEKGAHGIEERGIYRVHQFEKQEMIVICKPEESKEWYEKLWRFTVELFVSLGIPVRQLICCSGDLADLKYESCDVEAWSPRQKKYYEVGSCSNLTDAQARRLGIKYKDENGHNLYAHTLNNTVIASPRMLIAFLENNLQEDGSIFIPLVLRKYMMGKESIKVK